MKQREGFPVLLTTSILVAWLALAAGPGRAAEQAQAFLEGLRVRERQYYDMALEYLERMRTSPNCPDDFKALIDYEIGVTQVAASRTAGAVQLHQQQLDAARQAFQKFLAEHATHSLAGNANTQLANVLVEQGRMKAELASRPSKSEAEKKTLMAQARTLYQEASKVFEAAEKRIYEKAQKYHKATDPREIEERDQARRDLVQARLFLAGATYEIGKTYEPGSKQFKQHLNAAVKKYNELYETYGSLVGGLYARMWEGRAYKDLDENDKAILVFKEMLTLPSQPEAFRLLKTQSLTLLVETYSKPHVKRYEDAVARVQEWQKSVAGHEESGPEGLNLHFLGGKAALEHAKSLKANDPKRKDHIKTARVHLDFVARFRGELRRQANTLLMDDVFGKRALEEQPPADYADAKDRGDFAWGTMVVALGKAQQAKDAKQQARFTQQMNESRDQAIRFYTLAEQMKTDETPVAELNLSRFRLTYLYWINQDMYRCALLGEFLARRYPESVGASKGAEMAVKAYRNLFVESFKRSEDCTFETQRMTTLADYMADRWKDLSETAEARMMLLETAIDNKDLDKALEDLQSISPDSSRRAEAELRVGQAFWGAYVRAVNQQQGRPPQEALDKLVTQAQQTLQQGIQRMQKSVDEGGPVEYTLVYSVLSLAQILIDAGQADQAVKWLDDPKIGPVTLVAAKAPVTDSGNFRVDTYKAALRAYVGTQQLEKAEKAMNALDALVAEAGDVEAGRRLTQIYIRLGRELQERLERLRNEGKKDQMKKVSQGFEAFLDRISQRKEGTNFSSLNWVAETFFSLGAGMDPGVGETPPEAKEYYDKAAKTYLDIIKRMQTDEEFAPSGAEDSINVRRAACLRAKGECAQAMNLLVGILKKNEKRVDVQIEAAYTYQEWAAEEGKSGYYIKAIIGGFEREGRNLVWGWAGISRRVAPFDQYRLTFHEARYNLAVCRMRLARTQRGEEKFKTLEKAELDITRIYQLYPKMGGPEWFKKYDDLLKTIRVFRGQTDPKGLKAPK